MIKRRDLVKQFELAVQQEIINHNNVILDTNIRINSLIQNLEGVKDSDKKHYEYFVVQIADLSQRLNKIQEDLTTNTYELDCKINDI